MSNGFDQNKMILQLPKFTLPRRSGFWKIFSKKSMFRSIKRNAAKEPRQYPQRREKRVV